jgi:CubicO group peptidase (beta-lactamase class C family)
MLMQFSAIALLVFAILVNPLALATEAQQRRIDAIFAAYDQANSPGCAVGVIQDGNFTYRKAFGMGSLELGVPLTSQSIFYMGSVSKQFTAASIVLAAEQGFLSLDDDVRKFLPELPDYGHKITLRQMLHHTSGFRDFLELLEFSGRHAEDLHSKEELIDLIVRQNGLNNVPGEKFLYSNTNYFLLGEIVRRATGKTLAAFADENIFHPLGMQHTRFYDNHSVVLPGRVSAYDRAGGDHFNVDWSTNFETVGAGGLMSNVDDLLLWDRNFYANKLGKGSLIKELQRPGSLNDGQRVSYALGLELDTYRGLPIVDHSGALFGYRAGILRFPQQKFTVVCLCNLATVSVTNLSRRTADVFLEGSLQDGAAAPLPSGAHFPDPTPFAGKYLDTQNHFLYSFTVVDGNLMAWGENLPRIGANRFKDLGNGTITFEDSPAGMNATLVMDGQTFFDGHKVADLHLNEEAMRSFIGSYKSTELDATYRLSVVAGNLLLRVNWEPQLVLSPVAQDEFEGEDFRTLVFHRDANRRINGFSLSSVNARNIIFKRID